VQTLRRPTPGPPTMSSKWMMLLNKTSQVQAGAPSEICVLYSSEAAYALNSSESAQGALQTCTGETQTSQRRPGQ
jgi:hypothetical protein